jgi:hypothetical protein
MTKCTLLLFSVAIIVHGQTQRQAVNCTQWLNQVTCSSPQTDYVSPIINAMKASQENALKHQQLKAQREQFEQGLQLQKEQLKLERDRLTFEQQRNASEQERQHVPEQPVQVEIDKVLQSLRGQYSDFGLYEGKIVELAGSFLPGKTVTIYGYVEGLYLIAKHSADANRQFGAPRPEPRQDRD